MASAGFSLMIARRSPAAKISAPPPAVAKVAVDAPIPKVIVPMGEPFLWTSSTVVAVALTAATDRTVEQSVADAIQRQRPPGHTITALQDEQVAHGMAPGEHLGAAAPAQERGERVDPIRERDVLELDELGVAVGADQRRQVGAVQHLGIADRGEAAAHHGERQLAAQIGLERQIGVGQRRPGDAPGHRTLGLVGRHVHGAVVAREQDRAAPGRVEVGGSRPVMPGRGAQGVVAVPDQGHIQQEQPGLGADRVDLRQIIQAAARHRGDRVARALLDHRPPGELEIGAELGLEDAHIQERAVVECYLHDVRGLKIDMGPGQAPLVAGALEPGAVQLPQRDALGLRGGEHEGQIEGRNVARVHGAARLRDPLGVLGADVGIALKLLVDHREPRRQVDLLGPRLDERLALGIDGNEVPLRDHPAGLAAALLELQLVIALDRIEGVGGRQHLERAADADLAGDAEAVHLVGEFGDVQVGSREPEPVAAILEHAFMAAGVNAQLITERHRQPGRGPELEPTDRRACPGAA